MRKRTMTDIVKEPGSCDEKTLLIVERQVAGHHPCKMHGAKRVLKPGVMGSGVHEIRKSKLPHVPEPLHRPRIEEGHEF
ncbi:MAG: hypothetical protein A4E38_01303 [Methanoregulaceae archaeon PtaB.Bin108]|nr:MAG: hypothetical protein A4E38_01303 [Methanoregulaceae archaeon PtaB.Bin108]